MVLITSLSLFSFSSESEKKIWFPHLDKCVHFTFHFVLMVLGAFFLKEAVSNSWDWNKRLKTLFVFSLCYGLLIELLQWVMPFDRSAEIWDVLANLAGAVAGGLLIQKNRSLIDRLK
jgi:VanZ family protein